MEHKKVTLEEQKRIALVAHDNKKKDLLEWAKYNRERLVPDYKNYRKRMK